MVDGLTKLRVVTEKGCIHHCCLEYITEGLEHRRVRCAWMSRCKHLFFHPSASETFSCSLSFPLLLYCFFLFSPSICEPFLFFSLIFPSRAPFSLYYVRGRNILPKVANKYTEIRARKEFGNSVWASS